jgi:hypothetical protein
MNQSFKSHAASAERQLTRFIRVRSSKILAGTAKTFAAAATNAIINAQWTFDETKPQDRITTATGDDEMEKPFSFAARELIRCYLYRKWVFDSWVRYAEMLVPQREN